jgi:glyoxylase-like metal-dependent hydrolase (beta-lactamase superfamily II)
MLYDWALAFHLRVHQEVPVMPRLCRLGGYSTITNPSEHSSLSTVSVIQNRLASAGLLGLRERPVQAARPATVAGSLNNANFRIRHGVSPRGYTGAVGRLTKVAAGVLVATSSFDLTTTTVVVGTAGSGGCLLIDPAVTVAELAELAAGLADRGLAPSAGWSTHPHWDHVLWSRALGDAPRYAAPAAVTAAQAGRDAMIEEARTAAPGHDLSLLGQLTALDAPVIPWDGPEARVIVHDGHAPGHGAVFLPGTGVLVAGDMCSDVEIPLLDLAGSDPLGDYRAGLERLAAVPGVRQVVPGHGHPGDAGEFRRRLAADFGYLDALALGTPFGDPRLTEDWLRRTHDEQVRYSQH